MFPMSTKILIVDDMLTMRKIVSKLCKDLGFGSIIEAVDGQKAWEQISSAGADIDLIISDWNMPNCTGLDLLKRVRGDSRFKNIPFVMLTAESEGHQVAEAVTFGVDNYIIKPFTPDSVKTKLEDTYKKVASRLGK